MARPESEFSLGTGGEGPEEFSVPETPFQEIIPERTPLQPEAKNSQETLGIPESREEVEIPPSQEGEPLLEQPKNLNWLQRKIEEGKEKGELLIKWAEEKEIVLTEKDKKKLLSIPVIWAAHALISTWIGNNIGWSSFLFLIRYRDPSFLPYNLIPGVLRAGAIIIAEKYLDVKFSGKSKVVALFCGWAMPVESALMLKDRQLLLNEIKEHYFKIPLARARSVARKVRSVFRK